MTAMAKSNFLRDSARAVMFAAAFAVLPLSMASADTITWGVPVNGTTATQVGIYNSSTHLITYYIPLEQATSGTYGVTDINPSSGVTYAGTVADSGNGPGYLDMWIRFAPIAPLPLSDARLQLTFTDLDLQYVNDPAGFFETFQLFTATGTALSKQYTSAGTTANGITNGSLDPAGGSSGSTDLIYWQMNRTPGTAGANSPVTLDFYGPGLVSRITDPFYIKLGWSVPQFGFTGTNTPEYVSAKLTTTSAQRVPEASSTMLLGLGLGFVCVFARTRTA